MSDLDNIQRKASGTCAVAQSSSDEAEGRKYGSAINTATSRKRCLGIEASDDTDVRSKQQQRGSTSAGSGATSEHRILPLPYSSDSSSALAKKLDAILVTIASGRSIAAATGFLASTSASRDSIAKAEREMTSVERKFWDAYTAGTCKPLPPINWASDTESPPTSAKSLKVARRRAEALNRLYNSKEARPEHAVWFAKHQLLWLPLVKAMARVIGAERDIGGGHLADLQTVNSILGVVGEVARERKGDIGGALLAQVQAVLGREREQLRRVAREATLRGS